MSQPPLCEDCSAPARSIIDRRRYRTTPDTAKVGVRDIVSQRIVPDAPHVFVRPIPLRRTKPIIAESGGCHLLKGDHGRRKRGGAQGVVQQQRNTKLIMRITLMNRTTVDLRAIMNARHALTVRA